MGIKRQAKQNQSAVNELLRSVKWIPFTRLWFSSRPLVKHVSVSVTTSIIKSSLIVSLIKQDWNTWRRLLVRLQRQGLQPRVENQQNTKHQVRSNLRSQRRIKVWQNNRAKCYHGQHHSTCSNHHWKSANGRDKPSTGIYDCRILGKNEVSSSGQLKTSSGGFSTYITRQETATGHHEFETKLVAESTSYLMQNKEKFSKRLWRILNNI